MFCGRYGELLVLLLVSISRQIDTHQNLAKISQIETQRYEKKTVDSMYIRLYMLCTFKYKRSYPNPLFLSVSFSTAIRALETVPSPKTY